ncbi:MAG TPA: endonuclease/exonuclease/phosphatase family protein [Pirellulaceae bacterium]|nr:endonuclease/exonuclease/phosphatase family protein [Pirellulaceae bacterium]HMO90778.1 endonuclease/exonuclease/phosphatase family protein [Pirellulaceae bacterium]HMP68029.1 endonuclease/exonuclease/phosphatase family protein [Pirellulaceae bacterium]
MKIRLLTYNIHKAIGGIDRKYRPQRIIDTVNHYAADIVLLQEVDDAVPRSSYHRQVDFLGAELGYKYRVYQQNVKVRRGGYGNAILSHFPMDEITDIDLTIPPKKRRRALVARLHLRAAGHTRTLVIANIHLGLAGFERNMQAKRLLNHPSLAQLRAATPTIVAGDFNDVWGSLGKKIFEPAAFKTIGEYKSFPAVYPVRALDHVFFRGELKFCTAFSGRTKIAHEASDHLPIIAEFEVLAEHESSSNEQG